MNNNVPHADNNRAVTAGNVHLDNCNREQVQFSGAVQPHGALLVLAEPELHILQASANCSTLLGTPEVASLLGQKIDVVVGHVAAGDLRERIERQSTNFANGPVHVLRVDLGDNRFDTFIHRIDDGLIVEFEIVRIQGPPLLDLYSELQTTLTRLRATNGLQALLDLSCRRIGQLTGYDRVMAYKFLDDGSGEVMAETHATGLQSYLGLRYPTSDIPVPARRLFALSWLRHLPNSGTRQCRLSRR